MSYVTGKTINRTRITILVVVFVCAAAVISLYRVLSDRAVAQENEPFPVVLAQPIGRSKTIDDITVNLKEFRYSDSTLSASYSYGSTLPELPVHQLLSGFKLIRGDDTTNDESFTRLHPAFEYSGEETVANFDLSNSSLHVGERVDVFLGSYAVAREDIHGSTTIPLGKSMQLL